MKCLFLKTSSVENPGALPLFDISTEMMPVKLLMNWMAELMMGGG